MPMAKVPSPPKTGRTSKFDSLDLAFVEKLAKEGYTNEQLAKALGVGESTWYRWQADDREFREALKGWKDKSDEPMINALRRRGLGATCVEIKTSTVAGVETRHETIKEYPPDTAAAIFWLKNRQPDAWRDKQVIKLDLPKGITPVEKCDFVTDAVLNGEVTPDDGNKVIQGIKDRMAIEDATVIKERLDKMEKQLGLVNG